MDRHIKDYFCQYSEDKPHGVFHKVIALHEAPDTEFDIIAQSLPKQCRGWLELAQLPNQDRRELVRDFWMGRMVAFPKLERFLLNFFEQIDDIGIWVTQRRFDDPLQCHMVYSKSDGSGYFRGQPPATEDAILAVKQYFSGWILPKDFMTFLQIHDGFAKTTDCTGIFGTSLLALSYERFQAFLAEQESPPLAGGEPIDPKMLLPFYESFGMPFYQCFWGDWYPEGEMGNVYYSGINNTISQPHNDIGGAEAMAFDSFADWLMFYLENIVNLR